MGEWKIMDLRKKENIPEEGKSIIFLWETVKQPKHDQIWREKHGYKIGEGKITIEHDMWYQEYGRDCDQPKYWLHTPGTYRIRSGFTWQYAE